MTPLPKTPAPWHVTPEPVCLCPDPPADPPERGPGWRLVNGLWYYSAAWLGDKP